MKLFLLLFCLISHSLLAFNLKEKLQKAESGTYVVTEHNHMISLLHLHTIKEGIILFEDVNIPTHFVHHTDWKEWLESGAPGHTSWVLYEVDLHRNYITECYSLSSKTWITKDNIESFFIPFLNLNLTYLSEAQRMRSTPSMAGQLSDTPWAPPQTFHGKKMINPQYDVYTAMWPHDHTKLSGKQIVFYFDKMREKFPFPYWVQLHEGVCKFRMRALDSGIGLRSPVNDIPRRAPVFIGGVEQKNRMVTLSLNMPTYYDRCKLYAIDFTESSHLSHIIPFEIKREKEQATLLIEESVLASRLFKEHEYLWVLVAENPNIVVEHPQLFKWNVDN